MKKHRNASSVRRIACHLGFISLLVPCAGLAAPFDFGGKLGFENFQWEEFDDDGSKLLKESGARIALSGFLGNTLRTKKNFIYRAEAKLYFGSVDYDGQTQDGVPVTTDTNYTGLMVEGEAGYRAGNASGTFAWDIVGRAGVDSWVRDLDSSTDVNGQRVRGATEQYTIMNLRVGTGPYWQAGNWQGRLIAGLKLPVLTNEYIDKSDTNFDENLNLKPKGRTSAFLNFYNHIRLSDKLLLTFDAFYDSYRFDKSDSKVVYDYSQAGYVEVWQPKSTQDNYGVQAGVSYSY